MKKAPSEEAYWTAFCFQHESDPNSLHCTHKYLGPLTDFDAKAAELTIADFMRSTGGFQRFKIPFESVDYFDNDGDVRVLRPKNDSEYWIKDAALGFGELRRRLDAYREDDWEYSPHVTTDNHTIVNDWFDSYVLMQGERLVRRWKWTASDRIRNDSKRYAELEPVKEDQREWDRMEARIREIFKERLYAPLMKALGASTGSLQNSHSSLMTAIAAGRVQHHYGVFSGKFNASVTRELKSLGAVWDRKTSTFRLRLDQMPEDLRRAIELSEGRFRKRLEKVDAVFRQNLPAEIADSLKTEDIFDRQLWKVDKDIQKTLKKITVTPELTKPQRERIAAEWQNNMNYWIKGFAEKEIVRLRKQVQASAMAGNRYESLVDSIQASYGVTSRKARFLARQETKLLLAEFKETKYQAAGIEEYKWKCVVGSPAHPVRPSHKVLDNKIFRYDDPPVTTAPGEPVRRCNPGQDYNCRCSDIPIVRF